MTTEDITWAIIFSATRIEEHLRSKKVKATKKQTSLEKEPQDENDGNLWEEMILYGIKA